MDAAAVVLPGIPGGVGAAAKGVRALDKAADAVNPTFRNSWSKS